MNLARLTSFGSSVSKKIKCMNKLRGAQSEALQDRVDAILVT
jgi:hypothetical protein